MEFLSSAKRPHQALLYMHVNAAGYVVFESEVDWDFDVGENKSFCVCHRRAEAVIDYRLPNILMATANLFAKLVCPTYESFIYVMRDRDHP